MQEVEINRELLVQQFVDNELGKVHPTYDEELAFYNMVSDGDVEGLLKKIDYEKVDAENRGTLSKDRIKNLRYHIIVTIVMISRHCIEKGMDEGESYALSDSYIRKLDVANNETDLLKLHKESIFDYAKRMKALQKKEINSIHCIKAMDYIRNHLYEKISLKDIADHVKLERTYFSKHFKKEMQVNIREYILKQKLNAAKNMLLYSEYSIAEIAEYLAFSSSSYMGKLFCQEFGHTPMEYRSKHYRKHFCSGDGSYEKIKFGGLNYEKKISSIF